MLDRLFLPGLIVLAIAMIGFAMMWPQGLGARSPGPLGHVPVQQTPEMQAAMKKAGFEKVYVLEGGVAAWQQADLPLVKGR